MIKCSYTVFDQSFAHSGQEACALNDKFGLVLLTLARSFAVRLRVQLRGTG